MAWRDIQGIYLIPDISAIGLLSFMGFCSVDSCLAFGALDWLETAISGRMGKRGNITVSINRLGALHLRGIDDLHKRQTIR